MEEKESRQRRRARARREEKDAATTDRQLSKMVGGTVDGKEFHEWPKWEGRGVPTRDTCDLNNPRQAFLWTFTAMPGMQGAPLAMPTEYWELMSWRQWVLGGRMVAEPGLKWQPPASTMAANPWTASGKWVHPNTPDPEHKTVADLIRELPQQDRADLRAAVLAEMGLDDETVVGMSTRPGPPTMEYTVAALAERLGTTVAELLDALTKLGLPHLHGGSRVGREVGDRLIAHLGL